MTENPVALRVQTMRGDRTLQDKYAEAIRRSLPHLPAHMADEIKQLLTPEAIAVMVVVAGVWTTSHFFGVGAIADAVLLAAGFATWGMSAVDLGRDLLKFVSDVKAARSDVDLENAGKLFASIVTRAGSTTVSALFFRAKPKVYSGVRPNLGPPPPRNPGLFHKPTTVTAPIPQRPGWQTFGVTSNWGNITIHAPLVSDPKRYLHTLMHERVHQFLTPKLYPLREVRVRIAIGGYKQSYLLRYLEEALAQAYANIKVPGVAGGVFSAITFPVKEGYVTVARMGTEVLGHLMGSVNVGGVAYSVFSTNGSQAVR